MYYKYYNFHSDPFRLSPDHSFCYRHPSYSKGRAYMEYALDAAEGFVVVTGKPGMGKTTLINDLLANSSLSQYLVASIVTTRLEADDLLRSIAYEFCLSVEDADKATVIQKLKRLFILSTRNARPPLLIVDEAQNLSLDALEELRLLTNMQYEGLPLLQIFLLGQDELREKLLDPKLEQLRQRVTAATQLEPLSEEHTASYVLHRLRVVGWTNRPKISRAAIKVLHQTCHGVPRRVNQFCSRWFLLGAGEERERLTVQDAQQVSLELSEEGLTPRSLEESAAATAIEDDGGDLGAELFQDPERRGEEPGPGDDQDQPVSSKSVHRVEDLEFPDPLKSMPVRTAAPAAVEEHQPVIVDAPMAAARASRAPNRLDEPSHESRVEPTSASARSVGEPANDDGVVRHFVAPERRRAAAEQPIPDLSNEDADYLDDEDSSRGGSGVTRVLLILLLTVSLALLFLDWQTELKSWFSAHSGDLMADIRSVTKLSDDPPRFQESQEPQESNDGFDDPATYPIAGGSALPSDEGRVIRGTTEADDPIGATRLETTKPARSEAPSEQRTSTARRTAEPSPDLSAGPSPLSESRIGVLPPAAGSTTSYDSEILNQIRSSSLAQQRPEPPVRRTPAAAQRPDLRVLGEIRFGFDSSELDADATRTLDAVASDLKKRASAVAILVGHTDDMGPADYNRQLSGQRAAAVADYLAALGIGSSQMVIGDSERGAAAALGRQVPKPASKRSVQIIVADTSQVAPEPR